MDDMNTETNHKLCPRKANMDDFNLDELQDCLCGIISCLDCIATDLGALYKRYPIFQKLKGKDRKWVRISLCIAMLCVIGFIVIGMVIFFLCNTNKKISSFLE